MTSSLALEVIRLQGQLKGLETVGFVTLAKQDESADLLLRTAFNYAVLQVARLWDRFDANGFSLLSVAALLDDEVVLAHVHSEILNALTDPSHPQPQEADRRLSDLRVAISKVKQVDIGDELKRIRAYRHKNIAHPIYRTREERKKIIDVVNIDDLNFTFNLAVKIVQTFEMALHNKWYDYNDFGQSALQQAYSFYERVTVSDAVPLPELATPEFDDADTSVSPHPPQQDPSQERE